MPELYNPETITVSHGDLTVVLHRKGPASRVWVIKSVTGPTRLRFLVETVLFAGDNPDWWWHPATRYIQGHLNESRTT